MYVTTYVVQVCRDSCDQTCAAADFGAPSGATKRRVPIASIKNAEYELAVKQPGSHAFKLETCVD